jgi:hypothetical protein
VTPDCHAGNAIDEEEKAVILPVVENDPAAAPKQQVHQNRDEERSVSAMAQEKCTSEL